MTETGGSPGGARAAPAAAKYVAGVVGVAAAVATILKTTGSAVVAFIGVATMLVFMIAFFAITRVVALARKRTSPVAVILLWFVAMMLMATTALLFTSAFWDSPLPLRTAMERAMSLHPRQPPSVGITSIPGSAPCLGPVMGSIGGRVEGISNPSAHRVVVFVLCEHKWFVQPLTERPHTRIEDDGTWSNSTHTGTSYAAMLVNAAYQPPSEPAEALPQGESDILAVTRLDLVPLGKE